jgi:hypothetical protein
LDGRTDGASLAVVQLSAGGKLDLYNAAGSADVVVDVSGLFQY